MAPAHRWNQVLQNQHVKSIIWLLYPWLLLPSKGHSLARSRAGYKWLEHIFSEMGFIWIDIKCIRHRGSLVCLTPSSCFQIRPIQLPRNQSHMAWEIFQVGFFFPPVDWVAVEPIVSLNVLRVAVHRGERSSHTNREQTKQNLSKNLSDIFSSGSQFFAGGGTINERSVGLACNQKGQQGFCFLLTAIYCILALTTIWATSHWFQMKHFKR